MDYPWISGNPFRHHATQIERISTRPMSLFFRARLCNFLGVRLFIFSLYEYPWFFILDRISDRNLAQIDASLSQSKKTETDIYFNTYEEALEAGLKFALTKI